MKIVHSFWSKPALAQNLTVEKVKGGFRSNKHHYMSWALSCLRFREHYSEVELVTDLRGKKLLIDTLKLPYSNVSTDLERLNKYPHELWALGKLYAYARQNQPFLHVDGDVYIWDKFDDLLESADLIGQHLDKDEGAYHHGMKQLKSNNISIPSEMDADFSIQRKFHATNAGILGGNNIDFFKEFTDRAFWFVNQNLDKINQTLIGSSYALIYEQYLFSVLARKNNLPVKHYIDESNQIDSIHHFMRKYGEKKYVHLFSKTKYTFESCHELELNLLNEFPEYHSRILKHFAS